MKEIIENQRKDLAFNYLGIGQAVTDSHRLGPTDYSRARQLADIEKSLEDPEAFRGMESQRVTEALVAAKLSRGLEQARVEIDGRFARAIRLADADGNYRQRLEAKYEQIWTGFWWFDDFNQLKAAYRNFETEALKSDHSANVAFLCNLHQLLVNSVVHGHMTRGECDLDTRTATLRTALKEIASNKERPNNALEAETSILIIRMNVAVLGGKPDELKDVWRGFMDVLDRAAGLGEFKAERLVQMIEIGGQLAGNDPVYNELVEKLADFVSKRSSEAEGALVLLKRAKQLDPSERIDIIRLLGKAVIGLSKKEYTEQLVEALHILMIAYRGAGLLWAARATCAMAAASIIMEGEEDSIIPVSFVPTMKVWCWITLGLRHIPDLLFGIQMLNGALATLPLTEESKERVQNDIRDLEYSLGSVCLNLTDDELAQLSPLPDAMEGLGLFMARAALLYTLGYSDVLRKDGSIPEAETDEGMTELFTMLASQPVAKQTQAALITNQHGEQNRLASVLGMTVEIAFEGTDELTVVAEVVLASIEAFLATVIDQDVFPHTERFQIELRSDASVSKPEVETRRLDMSATIRWPVGLRLNDYSKAQAIGGILCGSFRARTRNDVHDQRHQRASRQTIQRRSCRWADGDDCRGREQLSPDSLARPFSNNRLGTDSGADRVSASIAAAPITLLDLKPPPELDNDDVEISDKQRPRIQSHRAVRVRSVIDVHAWDEAVWRGVLYMDFGRVGPPAMAFMFENEEATRKIFERWRERFGQRDANEEIHIAIIENLPKQPPSHYAVLVASRVPDKEEFEPGKAFSTATRSMTMTPDTTENLQRFLDGYRNHGGYYLLPAVMKDGQPAPISELAIVKRALTVKAASEVRENDIENIALRIRGYENRAPGE